MTKDSRRLNTLQFWQNVFVAAAQVTFGVMAALWFIGSYDSKKLTVLMINLIATAMFLVVGYKFSQRL